MLVQEHRNKENIEPSQAGGAKMSSASQKQEAQELIKLDQQRAEAEKEDQRRKEEAAAAAAAEEKRLREEARKAAEAEARRQAEAAERMRQEAEEKARQEEAAAEAAAAEEERQRRAAQQAAAEQAMRDRELAAQELAKAEEKVSEWCSRHGYKNANTQKKTMRGAAKFPLHTAVKHKDDEMVGMLLRCGADMSKADSKNVTPRQLAEKVNVNGSHNNILALLN